MSKNPLNKLSDKEQHKLVENVNNVLVSTNHTIFQLEQLSHSPIWVHELKKSGNSFLKQLMKVEKQFDLMASENEKIDDLYDIVHDFMEKIKTVNARDMRRYTLVLTAFEEHPEELLKLIKQLYNIKDER